MIDNNIEAHKIEQIIVFEDLQLRKFRKLSYLSSKITSIIKGATFRTIADRYKKEIDLSRLAQIIGDEEKIPFTEYLLKIDDRGFIDCKAIGKDVKVPLDGCIRKRINKILKGELPRIDPMEYQKYIICKTEMLTGLRVSVQQAPQRSLLTLGDLISIARVNLCGSSDAKKYCEIVKKGYDVRNHVEDVELSLSVTAYGVNSGEKVVILPKLPIDRGYECFYHVTNFIVRSGYSRGYIDFVRGIG